MATTKKAKTPSDLANAITTTADKADPGDSEELAEAKQLIAGAATLIRAGNAEDATKALKAAGDLIQGETTDGDADEDEWKPLVAELQQHLKALASMSTGQAMDAAIRNRARR